MQLHLGLINAQSIVNKAARVHDIIRSGQMVILKARPAMDAAMMSFHLSLSPTSSSSLTRFRPVVMPYNDKLALFRSFSILSIHRCFGRPTGRFPVGLQL